METLTIEKAVIYFDGGCHPKNPGGTATYGAVIAALPDGRILERLKGVVLDGEGATNNLAEYQAMIVGMKKAIELGIKKVLIRGDSELIIRQVKGVYACKSEHLRVQRDLARKLLTQFESYLIEWIPRDKNSVADALATEAYIDFCKENNRPCKLFKAPAKKGK